jgi:predicted ATPase
MLTQLTIENFRCLRSVQVPLRPFTVLIGPNDSGKSTFLAAIQYLINSPGFQVWDHWHHESNNPVKLTAKMSDGGETGIGYGLPNNPPLLVRLRPLALVQMHSQGGLLVAQGGTDGEGCPALGQGGEGVAAIFDYLLRRNRTQFFAAVKALNGVLPYISDLNVTTPHPIQRRLELVLEGGFRVNGEFASAGVRLLLSFVALAFHPNPPKIVLVEEPETGIHPKRLKEVVQFLRDLSEGKHTGQPVQVIATTHSPYLLDLVNLETDQLLVFQREVDGSCTAKPADPKRLGLFLDEFMLGEVWYNQGENGLVEKRPC